MPNTQEVKMKNGFKKVKGYLLDMGYPVTMEKEKDGILMITQESDGLHNLIIGVTDTLVIVEQVLINLQHADEEVYKQLLIKNRDIVHGAFVLDESGTKLIFRDTLQIINLDQNELEATINSLSLLLSEYSNQLIQFSKL